LWKQVNATFTNPILIWTAGLLGVLAIGVLDYFSGAELRVFPLYYAPISLVAWFHGRAGAAIVATLSTISWLSSNYLAGLQFTSALVWVANTLLQGASFAFVGILVAMLRAALGRERGLSRSDPLTSLLNTRAFYEEAERTLALCRRKERPVTIAYIDLDNFKDVNDALGHQAADDLLRQVGKLLRTSLRPSDLTARLGGDEFAILLPETGAQQAEATLARIHSLIAHRFAPTAEMTSSIGAVTFMTAPVYVEEMVHQADIRRYAAKNRGKNRVHLDLM
jgi:diguanylate cyclase (GGDEF)-like protein